MTSSTLAPPPSPFAEAGDPPIEVLPGVYPPEALPIRWTTAPPRPTTAARLRAEGSALPTAGGLDPYVPTAEAPWDRARALHLLRRTGYGATPAAIEAVLALAPGAAVGALVEGAAGLDPLPVPPWHDDGPPGPPPPDSAPQEVRDAYDAELQAYVDGNLLRIYEMEWRTVTEALGGTEADPLAVAVRGFRERLALMWHDHFVASAEIYFLAPWLSRYWQLLQVRALGDFKQFVVDIGLDPAMLVYLNGVQNRAGAPNENYARELMELFTMGPEGPGGAPNYTQQDVAEVARALTGYGVDFYGTLETLFVPSWHDGGTKTILGQTGAWGYADVVRILFEERPVEIATFVCRKLYRDLVYDVPNEAVVAAMAARFQAEGFQLAPVVRALLSSAHFFAAGTMGARIKSPLEHILSFHAETGIEAVVGLQDTIRAVTSVTDQRLFFPPDVSGWPGHHAWLTSSTLPTRWLYTEAVLGTQAAAAESLRAVAFALPDPYAVRALVAGLAALWMGTPFDATDTEAMDRLVGILLGGIPEYEWNPEAPSAGTRLLGLALSVARLPEAQLA
ncbi:MAG: DUF1800 domain-containing protein [Bacteroidota bacterium]